jgi:hypothetical protein
MESDGATFKFHTENQNVKPSSILHANYQHNPRIEFFPALCTLDTFTVPVQRQPCSYFKLEAFSGTDCHVELLIQRLDKQERRLRKF